MAILENAAQQAPDREILKLPDSALHATSLEARGPSRCSTNDSAVASRVRTIFSETEIQDKRDEEGLVLALGSHVWFHGQHPSSPRPKDNRKVPP